MTRGFSRTLSVMLFACLILATVATTQAQQGVKPRDIDAASVNKWLTVVGKAAGTDLAAQDQAVADGLRKAVEQACGTFLTSQSKSQDYKLVYDKVFSNTVGYVSEYKTGKIWVQDGITNATVIAHVSTQKFEKQWANIAHTVHQESNPRVIIVITDVTSTTTAPSENTPAAAVVQGKLEEFFLSKGIQLSDRDTAAKVNKRDIVLAGIKDDIRELAALGARFNAEVVIHGKVSARHGSRIRIAGYDAHQFVATLNVRVIRTDSAQLMVSKSFTETATSLQRGGGSEKALAKLAQESAPKLLKAVVEAWRKQIHVTRNIRLNISGMDYDAWKVFRDEVRPLRGVKALRLREITEGVANIDVEYEHKPQTLADRLGELKKSSLKVVEFNPNRLKLKVVK